MENSMFYNRETHPFVVQFNNRTNLPQEFPGLGFGRIRRFKTNVNRFCR